MKFSKRCFENLGTFASAKVQVETFFYNRFSSFTNSQAVKLKFGFSKIVKSVKQSFADLIKSIVKTISFYATLEACGRGIKKKKKGGGIRGATSQFQPPCPPLRKKRQISENLKLRNSNLVFTFLRFWFFELRKQIFKALL